MKPWKETWEAELHGNACECSSRILQKDPAPAYKDDEVLFYVQDGGRANVMGKRALLAAAAPEMARILDGLRVIAPDILAQCSLDKATYRERIDAVLRKAGVVSESEEQK